MGAICLPLALSNITPLDKKVVIVDGIQLSMDNPGVPYIEPRFANCRFADPPVFQWTPDQPWTGVGCLMGVAYHLTAQDFLTILKSEGGGTSYLPLQVTAFVLSPEGDRTGEVIPAFTLRTIRTRQATGFASPRYMKLICNGAREHNMPENYLAYLNSIPAYKAASIRQKLGRAFHILAWMPGLLVFFRFVAKVSGKTGTTPVWVQRLRAVLFGTMWTSYDWFGRWIFGDGEVSTAKD